MSYPGVWPEPALKNGKEDEGAPRQEYLDGIWVGYRGFDKYGVAPRYPFGHGLSYTTWKCEIVSRQDLGLQTSDVLGPKSEVLISIRVTNTGKMAGRRAVLLFASKPNQPDAEMPPKELVAFDSVNLGPGESTVVEFKVGFEELKYWSEAANAWQLPKGGITFTAE